VSSASATRPGLVAALAEAGCVFPEAEADELLAAAGGDLRLLDAGIARRRRGEPLAWIVGSIEFCGLRVRVHTGVYVPRAKTEALARRAVSLLPDDGVALDLCTGSGAVAAVMRTARPNATVLATDRDPMAVTCARANGVTALLGDLDDPVPPALEGDVDVLAAVAPYVPTGALRLLPRDVVAHEPRHALDGGPDGLAVLGEIARRSVRWLRPGGRLLLELGGDQAAALRPSLAAAGLGRSRVHHTADGDVLAIEAWRRIPLRQASATSA
jgi:release factor glutamine methyltransferase